MHKLNHNKSRVSFTLSQDNNYYKPLTELYDPTSRCIYDPLPVHRQLVRLILCFIYKNWAYSVPIWASLQNSLRLSMKFWIQDHMGWKQACKLISCLIWHYRADYFSLCTYCCNTHVQLLSVVIHQTTFINIFINQCYFNYGGFNWFW